MAPDRKRTIVLATLFATAVVCLATATFALVLFIRTEQSPRLLAEIRWGGEYRVAGVNPPRSPSLLEELTELDSARLRRLFPDRRFYRAKVDNLGPSGPDYSFYILAMGGRRKAYIETDEDTVKFLAERRLALADEAAALELVKAFGELRSYTLQEEQPAAGAPEYKNYPDPEAEKSIVWRTVCTPIEDGWTIGCIFLTDPDITACSRYAFRVGRGGELSLEKQEQVWSRGGYK